MASNFGIGVGAFMEGMNSGITAGQRIRDLGDDFFTLDEKNYTIKGEKSGKKFTLGDKVKFKVVGADMEKRVLDYALVD
jgi:ribonuclease R